MWEFATPDVLCCKQSGVTTTHVGRVARRQIGRGNAHSATYFSNRAMMANTPAPTRIPGTPRRRRLGFWHWTALGYLILGATFGACLVNVLR